MNKKQVFSAITKIKNKNKKIKSQILKNKKNLGIIIKTENKSQKTKAKSQKTKKILVPLQKNVDKSINMIFLNRLANLLYIKLLK